MLCLCKLVMTGKVYQFGTIRIRAELLKKTMTRFVFQLIYFSWNVNTTQLNFEFVRNKCEITNQKITTGIIPEMCGGLCKFNTISQCHLKFKEMRG